MSAIDAIAIEKYKEHRLKAGAAPATVNRELEALRRAFTLAVQHGLLPSRPHVERLREDNVRKGFFEPEQFEALLKHLNEVESGKARPVAAVVTFAYVTGWRLGEILGLRWRNVDFKAGTVRLEPGTTKNKEGRTFPMNAELRRLLDERREAQKLQTRRTKVVALKDAGEGRVFTRKNGRPIGTFGKRWHSAVRAIGVPDRVVKKRLPSGKVVERRLPGLLVHDFRRTAVRRLERAGVARSVAMKLVGHKTESIYRRYAIVSESDLREAVEKLGAVTGA